MSTIVSSPNGAKPEDAVGVADGSVDDGPDFVAELLHAFQTTTARERARVDEDTDRRRQALVDQVRAREAAEVERIRELAASDMKGIEAWVAGEKERIRQERERRTTELDEDLELSLSEHHSKIEVEIQSVESVIATYRAAVEAFFERLDGETDLVMIAQHASKRPAFPTIDSLATSVATDAAEAEPVTAEASPADVDDEAGGPENRVGDAETEAGDADSEDLAEPTLVGVMDPQAAAEPVESWATQPETSPEPVPTGSVDDVDDGGAAVEPAEPVTATIGSSGSNSGSLLQSIPVKQPMGWLRRHVTSGGQASSES